MKFLIDASSDARLKLHLENGGHNVTRIGNDYPADLDTSQLSVRVERIEYVLSHYAKQLDQFIVVRVKSVRVR